MPASAPILPVLQKAAADLRAGGLVLAEAVDGITSFATAGTPAPRADLSPENIIFEIGSITKVFTALILADTVLEGKAALSDPIGQHVADKSWLSPAAAAITLEQLATHTSGLPRLPTNVAPANSADPYADYTAENLHAMLRDYRPAAAGPYPSSYSNLGFGLLGHILEQIHGETYAKLIATRLAQPLGLTDTAIELDAEQLTRFAAPHSGSVRVSPWTFSALAGAGALRSTAADMTRFAQALLSGEIPRLAAAWNLVRERRVPLTERNAHFGLAIVISGQGDDTTYAHNGGTGGFRTYFELIPARRRATIVLVNNDSLEPGNVIATARQPPAPTEKKAAS